MNFAQSLADRGFTKFEPDVLERQMQWMRETADFQDRECLELGCRDGRHSLMALELGALCSVAVDGRSDGFPPIAERSPRISYLASDVRELEWRDPRPFDLVLCYGLLYHLPDPVALIERMCRWTGEWLFISTHCATVKVHEHAGYAGRWVYEGTADIDAMEPRPSFWLHPAELRRALDENAFEVVRWQDYIVSNQAAVWLAARPKRGTDVHTGDGSSDTDQ